MEWGMTHLQLTARALSNGEEIRLTRTREESDVGERPTSPVRRVETVGAEAKPQIVGVLVVLIRSISLVTGVNTCLYCVISRYNIYISQPIPYHKNQMNGKEFVCYSYGISRDFYRLMNSRVFIEHLDTWWLIRNFAWIFFVKDSTKPGSFGISPIERFKNFRIIIHAFFIQQWGRRGSLLIGS